MPEGNRPRIRSLLFAPGNRERMLRRVFEFGADAVNLDLEDAVPPGEKATARALVRETLVSRAGQAGPRIFVRVNSPDSDLVEDDLDAVVQPGVFAIQLTKVGAIDRVRALDEMITNLEAMRGIPKGSVQLMSSVDSANLVLELPNLIAASSRFYCVVIGGADFAMDLGLEVSPDMTEALWARSYGVLVSRAMGLAPPLHPPFFNLTDADGYRRVMSAAKRLGFQGGIALHPRQVEWAHEVFSVSEEQLRKARETVELFGRLEAQGTGTVQLEDGTFLDSAIIRWAEEVLRRAEEEKRSAAHAQVRSQ